MLFCWSDVHLCVYTVIIWLLSATVYDLWWCLLRSMGIVVLDWGLVGRWILGLCCGSRNVCNRCQILASRCRVPASRRFVVFLMCEVNCPFYTRSSFAEYGLGRGVHYLSCLTAVSAVVLVCGRSFFTGPALFPVLGTAFGILSVLQFLIFVPVLMKGFRHRPERTGMVHRLLLSGNMLFAISVYGIGHVVQLTGAGVRLLLIS